jgi:hypothetical protein
MPAGIPAADWPAIAYHELREAKRSQEALDQLIAALPQTAACQIAQAHAWRGEMDGAFDWLDRAYAQRDSGLQFVKYDVYLRNLRDPRDAALLKKMNLPPD